MTDADSYVHDPDNFEDDHLRDGVREAPRADEPEEELGRRGWVLVGVVFLSFVVIPGIILVRPPALLDFFTAYLGLALVPALLMGVVAVWAAVGR